jgi:hypothetical protein
MCNFPFFFFLNKIMHGKGSKSTLDQINFQKAPTTYFFGVPSPHVFGSERTQRRERYLFFLDYPFGGL